MNGARKVIGTQVFQHGASKRALAGTGADKRNRAWPEKPIETIGTHRLGLSRQWSRKLRKATPKIEYWGTAISEDA
jgi:hypothetical protein